MAAGTDLPKGRTPTYYGIIVFKLIKGSLFLTLAIVAYCLSDNDLPVEFQKLLNMLRVHPGNKFFSHLAEQIGHLSEAHVLWAAAGTLLYSLFSLVEGVGMMFRASWAGWLAIGESAFFVPIEIYELLRPGRFSWFVFVLLIANVIIVIYLFQNRHRLFRHHHHAKQAGDREAGN